MTSHKPRVCVVVPILNEARYIRESLDSLLAQDYESLEIVVYDGGSTDGTLEILAGYPVTTHVEPGLGQMAAINRAWTNTSAEFVTWWAGDDRYRPGTLGKVVEHLVAHPEAGFAYAWGDIIDEHGDFVAHIRPGLLELSDLMVGLPFLPQTVIIRRAALQRAGMMDERLRLAADYDLFLRLMQYSPSCYIPVSTADRRIHAGSEDSKNLLSGGQATIDVLDAFFMRPDLTPKQKALKGRGSAGARLLAAWSCSVAGDRKKALQFLLEASRLAPSTLVNSPVGRRVVARLMFPFTIRADQFQGFRRLLNRKLPGL